MQIKKIKIGSVETKNNVFFAPLAGFSDAAMRLVAVRCGAGLCFTEMVSCKGLKYTPQNSSELLYSYEEENLKAVQIFGNDPDIMAWAVNSEYLSGFDVIDVNMGCPVPKIFNNNEGSALLLDLKLASKVIESLAKTGKNITVKTRIGVNSSNIVTCDFAKMCEDSGAKMLTIHGRTRDSYYQGECNYDEIRKAKQKVNIPVIANGGIFTKEDADKMVNETGCDGVMVARGALENPLLISDILGEKCKLSLNELISMQIDLLKERYGDNRGAILFRKQGAYYLKGKPNGKVLKEKLFSSTSLDEVKNILSSVEF